MSNNRSVISSVRNLLRLNSIDNFISDRFILSVLTSVNVKLVVQQLQKRSYWNSPNLFKTMDCLEMTPVPIYSCCDIKSDCKISKSKLPLPQIVDCHFGMVIRGVWTIDGKTEFKELDSPNRLVNLMTIYPNKKFDNYYFIHENHLYVTAPQIKKVKLSAFFKGVVSLEKYDCKKGKNKDVCPTNPLDQAFNTLPKLEDDVIAIATEKIAQTFIQVPQDTTSDNKERD